MDDEGKGPAFDEEVNVLGMGWGQEQA